MVIDVEDMVAEGNSVCVQFVLSAKTAKGRDYRNHYHFVFKLRRGKISRREGVRRHEVRARRALHLRTTP